MSSKAKAQLVPTNLRPEEVVMDTRGAKDARYYCLPPFRGDRTREVGRGGGFPWHLVFQGHEVGVYNYWPEAKASLTGYPNSGNQGFYSEEECIDAWQAMCVLGLHPHPVDPTFMKPPSSSSAGFVNVSPRKSAQQGTPPPPPRSSPIKREGVGSPVKREGARVGDPQVLADLKRYCSPILPDTPSPRRADQATEAGDMSFVNFAIRGGGIISSSPYRYLELQRQGEQPDMLVTRSFQQASLFALEEDDVEGAGSHAWRCARQGLPPVKPGKVGWVHGTKLAFFQAHKEEFIAAAEVKATGPFYSWVTHLYLAKYGYNVAWDTDLDDDQDTTSDVDEDEDVDSLAADEAERRAEYFQTLRSKIGVWYNAQYSGSVEKKAKKVTFKQLFNKPELELPAPVKPRELHYYSRRFYTERIKDRVAARWGAVSRRPNPPAIIKIRNQVTKEAWNGESEPFKAEVRAAIEQEHKVATEAYSLVVSGAAPTTAAEYDIALNNAAYYLQPFADAIHERFGMNVAILMCGPIADRGGRIEVRSVHSGMSNGLVPQIWSDFDRAGFNGAQRSFVDFSQQCFTEEECRARSLNGMAMAEEAASHVLGDAQTEGAGPTVSASTSTTNAAPPAAPPAAPSAAPPAQESIAPPQELLAFDPLLFDPEYLKIGGLLGMGADDEEEGEEDAPPPGMGRALVREVAKMARLARAAYMKWLKGALEGEVDAQSTLARDRLVLRRVAEGMSVVAALAMDSEDEDDEEEEFGGAASTTPPVRPPQRAPTPVTPRAPTPTRALTPTPPTRAPTPVRVPTPPPMPARPRPKPKPKPKAKKAVAGTSVDSGPMGWETQDTSAWLAELRNAFSGFARGKDWGGEEWAECVRLLIALESAWGFPNKGLLSAPNEATSERPKEVPQFMQAARKWTSTVELLSAAGPRDVEGSFGNRWWSWWGEVQPPSHVNAKGEWEAPEKVGVEEWEDIGKMHGRNGMLLFVGALLWWGEAAAANEEERGPLLDDWRLAV
ncbi:hypothetical protein FB451DRAFT_1412422 [Mycena latifolia]|nr:hypothetical protein FB451DRAFT_1412422 [Mycena latifolia]